MGTWDKGLDYEQALSTLSQAFKAATNPKEKACLAVALIQLMNGTRVSEALDAFYAWLTTGKKEVKVRVRKHKREPDERLVVIPDLVAGEKLEPVKLTRFAVTKFLQRNFGWNAHSLRYARITYWAKQGVNPAIIASVVGHRKLQTLLEYIQKKKSEEFLREAVSKV